MQNFQDVENSKKIVSKQDSTEALIDVNSEGDFEQDKNCEIDGNEECNQGIPLKEFENQVQDDDLDVVFLRILDSMLILMDRQTFSLKKTFVEIRQKKMKEHHVIPDPVSSEESALIQKVSNVSGQAILNY
jgi:hypothetical protein